MDSKPTISEFRERLDKTLASDDLANDESLKTVVKNQLIRSSPSEMQGHIESFVDKRTMEVSNFLDMLRSASQKDSEVSKTNGIPHGGWKLKQDNDDYRVMYREGAQGTPFHTLLCEGYVDGPVDVCLCLSWESTLYKKWWPQISFPPFKITAADCLQKVRIGEQICLVRMKVAWPLSAREVVLHYFELEYVEDDLIVVLLNTISDADNVDKFTHGFTRDGIPEAKDIVRIDVVGGFALQKVTSNRSYFRTIATMDMKLDFVPPSLINFVSRHLIGSGFKLYKKAVASLASIDDDFRKALEEDPLYVRVREGLYDKKKVNKDLKLEVLKSEKPSSIYPEELATETLKADTPFLDQTSLLNHCIIASPQASAAVTGQTSRDEIEEEGIEETHTETLKADTPFIDTRDEIEEEEIEEQHLQENGEGMDHSTDLITEHNYVSEAKKVFISPEVEHALGILSNAISMVRGGGFGIQTLSQLGSNTQELVTLERVAAEAGSTSSEDNLDRGVCLNAPKMDNMDRALDEDEKSSGLLDVRNSRLDSPSREVNHNQTAPALPKQNSKILSGTQLSSSMNGVTEEGPELNNTKDCKEVSVKVNGIHEVSVNGEKKKFRLKKKRKLGCLHFISNFI